MHTKLTICFILSSLLVGCTSTSDKSAATRFTQDITQDYSPISINADLYPLIDKNTLNSSSRQLTAKGIEAIDNGELETASEFFNAALRLDLSNSYIQLLNGLTYHLMAVDGDTEKFQMAEQGYQLSYKFDNSNWLAKYYLGLAYKDQRRFVESQAALAEAAILNDTDPELLYDLAYSSYYANDPYTALGALTKLDDSQADIDSNKLNRALVVTNAALGRTEHSEKFLQKLKQSIQKPQVVAHLDHRVNAWQRAHEFGKYTPAQLRTNGSRPIVPGAIPPPRAQGNEIASDQERANDMVVVDVVIIRTQEDVSTTKGMNLLSGLSLQFGDPLSNTPGISFDRLRTYGDSASDSSAITNLISMPSVNYSLNIFNTLSGRNEILARPSLIALEGETSEFFSGVNVIGAAVSGGDGSAVSINREIGVKLAVKPKFLSDDKVRLEVEAERTFLTTPSSSVVFEFRLDTSKTMVNANVVMNFGETLVLSGLTEEESELSRDGVPILGDIPVLQYLFSKQGTREFRKSVVILLTPRRTHYVNESEQKRKEREESLSQFERTVNAFEKRNQNWFVPRSTISDALAITQSNTLVQEFKTNDFELENWHTRDTHAKRLKGALDFIFY